ncbi:MAG: Hsp20/alpha crystallin family protein [Candidatus Omnitrophota bacterium]|nr:MAG: Hsp20/alpha crystallin family protein [Candidatus Omnitrophota bacterium]
MALIKWRGKEWDPFKELLDLHRETDSLFDSSFATLPDRLAREGVWVPSVDVIEDKDNIIITADLPGVKQSDMDISVVGDTLSIKGERKQEVEVKEKHSHRIERFYGSFARTLTIPDYVDSSKISATYKDGILKLKLPKTEKAKPKQIKIDVK